MFEYDPKKSAANKLKHGIDFFEARNLWAGETVQVSARFSNEPRVAVFGMIGADYWTAIVTLRGENIRIISVRRSREDEIEFYERTKKENHG